MAETKEQVRTRLKALRKKHGLGEFKKPGTTPRKPKPSSKKSLSSSKKPITASRFVSVSIRGLI